MKKAIAILLSAILALTLTACGARSSTQSEAQGVETAAIVADESEQGQVETVTEAAETTDDAKKVLIVYFSPANSDTADAVSSATPRVGELSSVEYFAQLIGGQVDADMAKIVAQEAYPLPYERAADQARQEQDSGARPAFTLDVNPEDYDVIFVGYPVCWYHLPMIMQTFFDTYDFRGKTIIPFNTHGGSRDSGTYKDIEALESGATVLGGLAVNGEQTGGAEQSVTDWLAGLSY